MDEEVFALRIVLVDPRSAHAVRGRETCAHRRPRARYFGCADRARRQGDLEGGADSAGLAETLFEAAGLLGERCWSSSHKRRAANTRKEAGGVNVAARVAADFGIDLIS
jgi:hypothetical protein